MRVKMLKDTPVTTDGVNTIDAEAGDELEMGDGVAASLIADGRAAPFADDEPSEEATPKRRRSKKADAGGIKDAGAADENKNDGDEQADDEPSDDEPAK